MQQNRAAENPPDRSWLSGLRNLFQCPLCQARVYHHVGACKYFFLDVLKVISRSAFDLQRDRHRQVYCQAARSYDSISSEFV